MAKFVFLLAWVYIGGSVAYSVYIDEAFHNKCKDAGGIPYRRACLNPSAVIEIEK